MWRPPAAIAVAAAPRATGPAEAGVGILAAAAVADVVRRPVAELAERALAPAAHACVREDRARVSPACADRHSGPAKRHGIDCGGWLVVADVVAVAVAEPPVEAVTPAAHGAVAEQRARVDIAGGYGGDGGRADVHRPGGGRPSRRRRSRPGCRSRAGRRSRSPSTAGVRPHRRRSCERRRRPVRSPGMASAPAPRAPRAVRRRALRRSRPLAPARVGRQASVPARRQATAAATSGSLSRVTSAAREQTRSRRCAWPSRWRRSRSVRSDSPRPPSMPRAPAGTRARPGG